MVTSWPAASSSRASIEPTRPQPTMTTFTAHSESGLTCRAFDVARAPCSSSGRPSGSIPAAMVGFIPQRIPHPRQRRAHGCRGGAAGLPPGAPRQGQGDAGHRPRARRKPGAGHRPGCRDGLRREDPRRRGEKAGELETEIETELLQARTPGPPSSRRSPTGRRTSWWSACPSGCALASSTWEGRRRTCSATHPAGRLSSGSRPRSKPIGTPDSPKLPWRHQGTVFGAREARRGVSEHGRIDLSGTLDSPKPLWRYQGLGPAREARRGVGVSMVGLTWIGTPDSPKLPWRHQGIVWRARRARGRGEHGRIDQSGARGGNFTTM